MKLGEILTRLRKKNGLSQEDLAEKLNITRQTISKWELNETSPNINQAKDIAKLFNISLDELVGNNVNDILVKKIDSTEKLTRTIMKFNIFISIILVLIFAIIFFLIILSLEFFKVTPTSQGMSFTCMIGETPVYYDYVINMDMDNNITSYEGYEVVDFSSYKEGYELEEAIVNYYNDNGGKCGVIKQ